VTRLHYQPGDRIPVGAVLVSFAAAAPPATTPLPAAPEPPQTPPAPPAEISSARSPQARSPAATPGTQRVLAAPVIRRRARELGLDLTAIQATGPGGRITLADVERSVQDEHYAPADTETPPTQVTTPADRSPRGVADHTPAPDFAQWGPVERVALSATRRQIARKMAQSMFTAPHAAALDEADVTELERFRTRAQERLKDRQVHLTLLPFVMKATIAGLKQFPALNASLDDEQQELILKRYYHFGIAVDTPRGLIVPVVHDVDRKTLVQLAVELGALVQRTRAGKATLDELHGSTFTLTNAGALGGSAFIPIINYPEVAILGMGRAQEKPVVRNGQVVVRTMLPLSLAFDHRVIDGADVVRFLSLLMRLLEDPTQLLLDA